MNRTPFYAEGGGQLADGGRITLDNGAIIEIDDVQNPIPGLSVHRGRVISGAVSKVELRWQRLILSDEMESQEPIPQLIWCIKLSEKF